MKTIQDKCRGSLVGGAVGDALGYEVEFSSLKEILQRFGVPGITAYETDNDGIARFSDDTQMTLFTAEGLLNAISGCDMIDPDAIRSNIKSAYQTWYDTQTEFQLPKHTSWLSNIRDLWSRRAPGTTCLSALSQIKHGKEVANNSKGCGGVMRVAPIGIYFGAHPSATFATDWTPDKMVATLASDAAYITHHHDFSNFSSALAALIVYRCIKEDDIDRLRFRSIVEDCIPIVLDLLPESNYGEKFRKLINEALNLAESDVDDFDAIRILGEGWVAEETIAIAVFSVMRYISDFEKCIVCAVNHDGDSDSTGAVAGNIIGAITGYDAIPEKFKSNLELHDLLLTVADDLAGVSSEKQMKERYVYHKPYNVAEDSTIYGTMKYTPKNIKSLGPDDIFVFGSNLEGMHAGGAARVAYEKFGARWGQGVGLQGQSYAIPTMQGGVETIKPYVDEFLEVARECDQNTFFVTRIGCGIAGFTDEEIAPLFKDAMKLYNVRLPESFVRVIKNLPKSDD